MTTDAQQDYIKTIYKLQELSEEVSTSALAVSLGVTAASVSGMLNKLSRSKLVTHRQYRGVRLTRKGRSFALDVLRRHRLIELFLVKVLEMPWDSVHQEGEKLEHAVSDEVLARIDKLLGYPKHDPHGAPIPAIDGYVSSSAKVCLSELEPGQTAVVAEVSDHDQELLQYLGALGIYPQKELEVIDVAPYDGPITISIQGRKRIMGRKAAGEIFVTISDNSN